MLERLRASLDDSERDSLHMTGAIQRALALDALPIAAIPIRGNGAKSIPQAISPCTSPSHFLSLTNENTLPCGSAFPSGKTAENGGSPRQFTPAACACSSAWYEDRTIAPTAACENPIA